jgi:type II secretory pathway component PulC
MQQNKMIPAAVWIACLTIAAYVLAQAAAVSIRRSFDAALRNAATVAQNRSERSVPPLPRRNASDGEKTASVPKTDAGTGVKVEQVSDTEWILDRTSVLANTRNLNRFLMQARAVPYRKQGRTVGFRITGISQGSLYEKIGLRNGDVLLRVNMRNLDNPAKLFSLYQEMRNKRHISILLSRNGQDQTFHYDIR